MEKPKKNVRIFFKSGEWLSLKYHEKKDCPEKCCDLYMVNGELVCEVRKKEVAAIIYEPHRAI